MMDDRKGRVLVAPDSFKGTFTAAEVAEAAASGLERVGFAVDRCPVADGGEGSLDVLLGAHGGTEQRVVVDGPLGDPVTARLGVLDDERTAVVEAAQAVGLHLARLSSEGAERASTRGVGQLIAAAADAGARRILVAVGGTATSDGGAGAVEAIREAGGIDGGELLVLCDVTVPFESAARVFAAQKGADRDAIERLSARLGRLASEYERDPRGQAGGGAGGGLAGGLWAELGAELVPGAAQILDSVGFDARLRRSLAVVVGEGKLDEQTEQGKVVAEVCRRAGAARVPVHAIVGGTQMSEPESVRLGLGSVFEATTLEAIAAAAANLGRRLAKSL